MYQQIHSGFLHGLPMIGSPSIQRAIAVDYRRSRVRFAGLFKSRNLFVPRARVRWQKQFSHSNRLTSNQLGFLLSRTCVEPLFACPHGTVGLTG